MPVKTNDQLKQEFLKGSEPSQESFADLIDSMRNMGVKIPALDIEGFQEVINSYYTDEAVLASAPVGTNFQRWVTKTAGAFVNFPDLNGNPLVVSAADLGAGIVEFWGKDGIWKKQITNVNVNALSIITSQIADKAIIPEKANFFSIGKNKFNPLDADVKLGRFIDYTNGNLGTSSLYNATGFIPVTAGQQITVSFKHQLAWYNSSKDFVSGDNTSGSLPNITLTVPAGVSYMRQGVALASWATFQVEVGASATSYEPYLYEPTNTFPTKIQVRNSNLKDGDIGKEKLNFLQKTPNKNLFNPADSGVQLGYYVDYTSGLTGPNAAYNATGFIPVTAGQQYTMSYKHMIAWYNSSKGFIIGSINTDTNKTQTAPAGAAYCRCTVALASWATFQFELGSVQTAYEAFYYTYYLNDGTVNIAANELTRSVLSTVTAAVLAGLIVGTAQLQDAAVSVAKTNFFAIGKNKFNPSDPGVQLGRYIDYTTGVSQANSLYNATGYIPVTAGQQITVSYKHQLAWYDANKGFVTGDNTNGSLTNITLTVPAGVSFMRQGVLTTLWATFQVENGATATPYEAYCKVLTGVDGIPLVANTNITATQLQGIQTVYGVFPAAVAVAPKMYIPVGKEIAIYYENINKYAEQYQNKTDIALTNAKITGRCAKLVPSATGTSSATVTIFNEQYNSILTKTVTVEAVSLSNVNPVAIANIGDSYTYRSTFINPLLASTAATGVTFVGIRNNALGAATSTVRAEGRGGYSLSAYTTLWKNNTNFSPFMQPGGAYKFYGVTGYWKIVNGAGGYDWSDYPASTKGLFNPSTGYLIAPNVNDVMYDDALAGFVTWDGSAWVSITEATLAFTFNYAKYRSAWGVPMPNIVHIPMGTNDFAASTEPGIVALWLTWKANMDTIIASLKADNSAVKIIVAIPNSSGKQGNEGIAYYERRKRAYWYHASQIIANYSGRESENIYLLDYHSCVDRQFGFDNADEKPFNDYTGTFRERYKSDPTHLGNDGFNQMGDLYLGMIQKLR